MSSKVLGAVVLLLLVASADAHSNTKTRSRAVRSEKQKSTVEPLAPRKMAGTWVEDMSVKELRRYLADRDVRCDGCVERRQLVDRALEVANVKTHKQRLAQQLVIQPESTLHQLNTAVKQAREVTKASAAGFVIDSPVQLQPGYVHPEALQGMKPEEAICQPALVNGTQYCHSILKIRSSAW